MKMIQLPPELISLWEKNGILIVAGLVVGAYRIWERRNKKRKTQEQPQIIVINARNESMELQDQLAQMKELLAEQGVDFPIKDEADD